MSNEAYGMTPQGFIPKRLARIVRDLNENVSLIVDAQTGERAFVNQSDDSILGQVLGVVADGLSECWEAAYDASVQFDPLKNSGAGQAGTLQLNALLLKQGSGTIVEMSLGGEPGTVIPKGAAIGTADGKRSFETLEEVTLNEGGMAKVSAACTEKGPYDPEENTVVQIQTPVPGWARALNSFTHSVGTSQETEEEARKRQQKSTSNTGYRHVETIYSAIMNIPGVVFCRVYQNSKYCPVDLRGIPYKEVAAVIEGGDENAIVDALFHRFPVTILGYGNTHMVRHDKQGVSYDIAFSRPIDVPIWMEINLEVTGRADFPDSYVRSVQYEILRYAMYGGDGNEEGFPPGADIVTSRLYTPINRVPGHRIVSVKLGTQQGKLAVLERIPIAWNKVGRFAIERITVNKVEKEDED